MIRLYSIFVWFAILAVFLSVVVVACGDDDDDDNERSLDDDSTADENSEDDDIDDDTTDNNDEDNFNQCAWIHVDCFGWDFSAGVLACEELYSLESDCSQGAADAFVECVGTNCNNWTDCAAEFEDAIDC